MKRLLWIMIFVSLAAVTSAVAQSAPVVTTRHRILVSGHVVNYTAITGRIAIRDAETGNPHGYIFFTAYRVASPHSVRPLTFVWNGGPGSNSAPLHFLAFGPKRLVDGKLVDNNSTLLTTTDLVFVDPVGTGFSRPARAKFAQEFYGTLGDIASVAEFVRAWRIQFDALAAPLYLIGESYGVWRAAGVAEALEKQNQHVAGIVLISGGAGVGKVTPENVAIALRVPNYAATALFYHLLPADLGTDRDQVVKAATGWAQKIYLPALQHRADLTPADRDRIADSLARYTGYPASRIDRATLTITPSQYLHGLLRDQGKVLDTLDMRRTAPFTLDASGVIEPYLRNDLGYHTDLIYLGLDQSQDAGYVPTPGPRPKPASQRWDYNSAPITPEAIASAKAGEGPPGTQPWAIRAIGLDPKMKVFVAAGMYDSYNSCAANNDLLQRINPKVAGNYRMQCYPGGHMMYLDAGVRRRLSADVAMFIQSTDS